MKTKPKPCTQCGRSHFGAAPMPDHCPKCATLPAVLQADEYRRTWGTRRRVEDEPIPVASLFDDEPEPDNAPKLF